MTVSRRLRLEVPLIVAICLSLSAAPPGVAQPAQAPSGQQPSAQTPSAARPMGTIKSISGNSIVLTTDAGIDVTVLLQDATKLVRIAPGQKDLKDAVPIPLQEVQPGDRVLVRGRLTDDGKSVLATSLVAMKKADIAEKQGREREEWQKHGVGGLVSGVDAAANLIKITLPGLGEKKIVDIHLSKDTILRRYAPGSIKFDDARPAPLDQVKPGDQLRARGARNADGSELTADEIVSGTFRNIAGTISAIDASTNSIIVQDLASQKPVTVKITSESHLRKLPPPMAQRIALRLKGMPADASAAASGAASNPNSTAGQPPRPSGPPTAGPGAGTFGGMGRPGGGGPPDLQQVISRMPASTIADLQKGDAVMLVATEGGPYGAPIVITLLGGVEPILEAAPNSNASTILSPWSLSGPPGGEVATP